MGAKVWDHLFPKAEAGLRIAADHFPTPMQALIFRCWETTPAQRIAAVLKTDTATVMRLADQMGLRPQGDVSAWETKGYVTVIKQIWNLLPYEQMLELLNWTPEYLAYILKEEDFLEIKLGAKPDCPRVEYRKLTDAEKQRTEELKEAVNTCTAGLHKISGLREKEPFDFLDFKETCLPESKLCPESGVMITEKWRISDETGFSASVKYAELFDECFREDWGFSLTGCAPEPAIRLLHLKNSAEQNSEYHEIDISPQCIAVAAPAPEGILRGLMHLTEQFRMNGGPWLTPGRYSRTPAFETRFIYSFCGLYGTAFDVDPLVSYPESLLQEYAKCGVNGIWLQCVLYRMAEFPFDSSLSDGWQRRVANLKKLVAYARQYGIKVYLYLNEPRAMPLSFFEKYPNLKGFAKDSYACLCTMTPEVRDYLERAVSGLCRQVPELGGFFTITRSENLTNCYSHANQNNQSCPRCKNMEPYAVLADINNLLYRAMHKANPQMRLIAWMWSLDKWFDRDTFRKYLGTLDAEIIIMSTSEVDLQTCVGGINGRVEDYTMSHPGPSDQSRAIWESATDTMHETAAKIQINNTWECSTTPYLPVFQLVLEHLKNLQHANVRHLMLSWTLGGYPSPNIKIASSIFFRQLGDTADSPPDAVVSVLYGKYAQEVLRASEAFSEGFRQFPFHIGVAYAGPQNGGPSNPLYAKPTGVPATMTCFAYDDLDMWRSIYPVDVFENQFCLVSEKWIEGLSYLQAMPDCEFKDIAAVGASLFIASYQQIHFIRLRDAYLDCPSPELESELRHLIHKERELAAQIYGIMLRNPSVGYEAANHYYFNRSMLLEKIVNCSYLLKHFYESFG